MSARSSMVPSAAANAPGRTGLRGRAKSGEAQVAVRAALSSLAATLVDGGGYELCLVGTGGATAHYAGAAVVGAALGAITNFSLNRWWAFRPQHGAVMAQALRYAVGSALTLLVLQGVLWLLVERLAISPSAAWLPGKVVTWAAFSYPFQRTLVFAGERQ